MRIALITDGIAPYVLGGMQRHSFFICKYLAANGHHVDLYHTNQSNKDIGKLEVFTEEEKKNITSIVIPQPHKYRFPGHYVYESYLYSKSVFQEFVKRPPVDFIYTKGFAGWKLINEKARLSLPPVAVKFHGLNMFQVLPVGLKPKLEAMMFRPVVRKLMFEADYNFSYGGKITDITEDIGVSRDRIIEVPTGITPDWLREPVKVNRPLRFIYIGRYERLKGVEEMNVALKALKTGFEMHFVGPIPNEVRIKQDNIFYHGEVRDVNVIRQHLDRCDVLLCPSYSEGMPNAVIEAMSRGLTCIATDVGAMNVMLNDKNGWLLKTCTEKGIQEAMSAALNCSDEELMAKKRACHQFVKEHLIWDNIYHVLITKLEKVIGKK